MPELNPHSERAAEIAKQIVRDLAASDEPIYDQDMGTEHCMHCYGDETFTSTSAEERIIHEPTCVWKRARDWVKANPMAVFHAVDSFNIAKRGIVYTGPNPWAAVESLIGKRIVIAFEGVTFEDTMLGLERFPKIRPVAIGESIGVLVASKPDAVTEQQPDDQQQ